MINESIYNDFERTFSLFIIGCNPPNTVAQDRTIAFKDLRRLMRGLRKGPINSLLYKKFSVINQNYYNADLFQLTLVNKNNSMIFLDNTNYIYFKHWIENIKLATTLNYWK